MKSARGYVDLGSIFDEIFERAQDFSDQVQRDFGPFGGFGHERRPSFDERVDLYPNFSYPPMNVYMTADRSMVFEFALAGFEEKDISLAFQGDYMIFSARIGEERLPEENIRYFKRRLKLKDIEKQKYYVPLDKYAQDQVRAVFRNGILKVTVPPKEEQDQDGGIKIEIVTEDPSPGQE
jgi:HSP20 family molecular chaperone IbpA